MATAPRQLTAAEAVEQLVPEGTRLLAVGGMHMHHNPMALVRALIRSGRRVQRLLTSPSACLNADLLVGAGAVEEIQTAYVGFEHLGLAPAFRRAVETASVRLVEVDEATIVHGLYAGAGGLPFVPLPHGLEQADVHRVNFETYVPVRDPFTDRECLAIPALRPDVALVHATEADERGNAVFAGACFTDRLMAMAAHRVVLQVERIVPAGRVSAYPAGSTLPGFLVDALVVAPGGCLPTAAHGDYGYDEAELREYLRAARTPEGFEGYLEAAGLRRAGATA